MPYLKEFIVHNFALFCLSVVMVFNAVMHYHTNKKISKYSIYVTITCNILAVTNFLQLYFIDHANIYGALLPAIIGYTLRPCFLYFFIKMSEKDHPHKKYSFLIWIPLLVNAILFLFAFIPGSEHIIFGYEVVGSKLNFVGGPLRYFSHIVSLGYLGYLTYISISQLKAKHIMQGLGILSCAFFILVAVIIESFFNHNGDVEILNTTVMVSTIAYYLFLYKQSTQIDTLTNLFNRETFYRDGPLMVKTCTGIIQYDINGLKYINDHNGHHDGDKCIASIADTISKSISRSMYAYRLGGDEFLVIVNNSSKEEIESSIAKFKELLSKTPYHCSAGYAYKDNKESIEELMKKAEENMYLDKNKFYKDSKFERRKI